MAVSISSGKLRLLKAPLSLVLCAIAVVSSAQVTKVGSGTLLRMKYIPNRAYKWEMVMKFSLDPKAAPSKLIAPLGAKVKKVSGKNGTVFYTSGPMKMNGAELAPLQEAEVVQDSRGLSKNGALSNGTVVNLPAGPVKVGATWTGVSALAGGMGAPSSQTVKVTYTYVGTRVVKGITFARIGMAMQTTGTVSILGKGEALIDGRDGWLSGMKLDMRITTKASGASKPMTIRSQVDIIRK